MAIESLLASTDLSQEEIDARVKLSFEKSPPPNVVAPQILAVLSTEDKME